MRNIDKIKQMNCEELVEFIMQSYINDKCEACIYNPNECKGNCREGMQKWFDAIDLEGTVLSKDEEAILNYCAGDCDCYYLERDGVYIRAFGYISDDDEEDELECRLIIKNENLFSWFPNKTRMGINKLLEIKQVVKTKEEKNIETNETLYNLIDTCRNKLSGLHMKKETSINGDWYRPIKNTRRQQVYKTVYNLMQLFDPSYPTTTYEVMQRLQSGEIHKKQ
jgi:hypothetical protein